MSSDSKVRIGVIGYGYWGPNLVRNFVETPGANVIYVSDLRSDRLKEVQKRYPHIQTTTNYNDVIRDPSIDAIAIATPVSSHFNLALEALKASKHVLVEKPLAENSIQSQQLIDMAEKRGLVLMVDHTFIYTSAVQKIREIIAAGNLGDLLYYDSVRINLGFFQHDINVLWDLAVHDLSIMNYILPNRPIAVSATATSHLPGKPENIAYLTLFFDNHMIGHVHANWLAPVKIRRTLIGGSHKMIIYDDIEPSEKVKVYDRGITLNENQGIYQALVSYRTGDLWAPQLDMTEALKTEALHFVKCIQSGTSPLTDGQSGLEVVKILEAASRSLQERGKPAQVSL